MNRRTILALLGAVTTRPRSARAQPARIPVIGFLNGASFELSAHLVRAFHRGLQEAGYAEGRNVAFENRSADGRYDRLPALAAELVARRVDLIFAAGPPTGLPAKAATGAIPIVFVTGSDPVQQGLVGSLHRPGGNLTGVTTLAVEMGQKRIELLREAVPAAKLIGALINPRGPNVQSLTADLDAAVRAIGLLVNVLHASREEEFDAAFAELARLRADALVIGTDTFFNSQSARLGALTRHHRVPAVYQYREFVAAGGLMSYGGSITDAYHIAGTYAARILDGEKPSNLAVQRSTKAELFINQATAKAIGLRVPATLLVRAEEIIE